jgi:hypothetical protein
MSDVYIDAGAKDNVSKVFKQIGDNTKTLGDSFKTLLIPLAAIGGAFLAIKKMSADFQKAIDMGGRLHELSRQTDESAGNLMILQRAFQNAGAGAETVGTTLARMNRFIAEAGEGGKAQTEIMGKLGLTMTDLADKTPTEQLKLLAERVAGLQSPADRTNVAMQLFGRSGAELVPLFRAMGVELENARNQLGSAPAVADKAAAMFNTLGNNIKAVREKSAEFAFGLLSELLPNLVAVTDRLANIDAAGVGAKLSEYAKKTLDWATQTFKLGDALKNIELAFKAITEGNIGDGLKLMFLTARDTALNAVNEISAAAMASLNALGKAIQKLFANDSWTMTYIKGALDFLAVSFAISMANALASTFGDKGIIGDWKRNIQAAAKELEKENKMTVAIMAEDAKYLAGEWGQIAKEFGKDFNASYEANIKKPLIEMEEKLAETEAHTAKVAQNLEKAADSMSDIANLAPSLEGVSQQLSTIGNDFSGIGSSAPLDLPTLGDTPTSNIPGAGDIGKTIADAFSGGNTPASGSGGGSSPSGSPAPRQLTNRERALMSPNEKRAADLESRGMFNSADRAREQGERKVEQQRRRDANRELQKDLGLGGSVGKTPEQIAREEGKVNPLNREDFQKRVKEIEEEIERRAGQGDGTRDTAGGAGGGGKDEPTETPLERLVSEIKSLVEKIEPKLPVAAMTV